MEISPLHAETAAALLLVGHFHAVGNHYERDFPEEGTSVVAMLDEAGNRLHLSISPSVTVYGQHAEKRRAAGCYFEIAAKYGEKVGGTITQLSNVAGCSEGVNSRELAHYPLEPMLFDRVCAGFRGLFLNGSEYNEENENAPA